MAYGNWGAFVYENGERRQDKEDVGVFDTDEKNCPSGFRIFANILKNREKYAEGKDPWYTHSHHAVLGDGIVRLCGYKDWAELWVCRKGVPERIDLETHEDASDYGEVYIDGKAWKWEFRMYESAMVDLELVEPDGTVWKSTCGYGYGAGHMD